ncbi:MAG: ion transporter [Saprospiraceae bacterium]|nr:ion transporter [Saprospiraceae bacterium]
MSGVVNRKKLYEIIFESDTRAGRNFDIALLVAIVLSILVVMLESVELYRLRHTTLLHNAEWFFTFLFTIEYLLRLYSVQKPLAYATSRFGVIDLLAILPNYLSLFFPGLQFLLVIRALRLLRVFRIFKMGHFLTEGNTITTALYASRRKITVFILFILLLVTVIGSILYVVESPYNENFNSIPISIYWAIVTITTVGYGDISPVTDFGRLLAAMVMLLGYAVLAVPTGIVSSEMMAARKEQHLVTTQTCPHCIRQGHDADAAFCKYCGGEIN